LRNVGLLDIRFGMMPASVLRSAAAVQWLNNEQVRALRY
jgi:hypothetical protein